MGADKCFVAACFATALLLSCCLFSRKGCFLPSCEVADKMTMLVSETVFGCVRRINFVLKF